MFLVIKDYTTVFEPISARISFHLRNSGYKQRLLNSKNSTVPRSEKQKCP